MKQINVICNNIKEFQFLAECIQWLLSKQNMRYKSGNGFIIDICNQSKYVFVSEHTHVDDGNECLWMCKEKDNVHSTLKLLSEIEILKLSIKVVSIHKQFYCVINENDISSNYVTTNQKINESIQKMVSEFESNFVNDTNKAFLKTLPILLNHLHKSQYLSLKHTLIELQWIDGKLYYINLK